jgi:CBS domain-containing protein
MSDGGWGTVEDVMQRRVEVLAPDAAVHDAVQVMLKRHYPATPVADADGTLRGIFSEQDCVKVLTEAVYQGWPPGTVASRMSTKVETATPDEDLLTAARRFGETGVRSMPVVEAGRVIGLLTRADLMRALDRKLEAAGRKTTYELIAERRH